MAFAIGQARRHGAANRRQPVAVDGRVHPLRPFSLPRLGPPGQFLVVHQRIEQLIRRALETVAMAKVGTSAEESRELLYLAPTDGVTLNRRHLLAAAKAEARGMAEAGFVAPRRRTFRLPGKSAYATFEMALSSMRDGHFVSDHDLKIALKVAHVMTGGDCSPRQKVTEQHLLDLEREAFLSLCGEEKTLARISHMLETNKPLRN